MSIISQRHSTAFKKYCISFICCLLIQPCFAETIIVPVNNTTKDILSYAMTSYLHGMLKEKVKALEGQYNSHVSEFNQQRNGEIEKQLEQKRTDLNATPSFLTDKQIRLNEDVDLYNSLISQAEQKQKEHEEMQNNLNASIQQFNERNEKKSQITPLVVQINAELDIMNQHVGELNNLELEAHRLWEFYNTKAYESETSIVQPIEALKKWKEEKDRALAEKKTNYDTQLAKFNEWKRVQTEIIDRKKSELHTKRSDLEQFVNEINKLVEEYNTEREVICTTNQCKEALLAKLAVIEEKKAKKVILENKASALALQINELIVAYNQKHDENFTSVETLRVDVENFSAAMLEEQNEKEQAVRKKIEEKRKQAEKAWEQAQATLNQRKEDLNTTYGTLFSQFVESISHWASTNQTLFNSVQGDSISEDLLQQMQATNSSLCEYQKSPLAVKAKEICGLINQAYSLLSDIYSYYSDALPETLRVKYDEKTKELNELKQRMETLKKDNDALRSELDTEIKTFNDDLTERQRQYETFSTQLTEGLKGQLQQIQRTYYLKTEVLTKEYILIDQLLFKPNTKDRTALNEKKEDFQLAVDNFTANIPEFTSFPEGFDQTTEMLSTVIKEEGWDVSFFPKVVFSEAVDIQGQPGKPINDDRKKQVISSWLDTSFVSTLLKAKQDQIAYVFENYRDTTDDIEIFLRDLFLEGIYDSLSIQESVENGQTYYQVAISERLLLILSSGSLSVLR